eukprot:14520367-Ditylum_brightwellii.AAC.1
MNTWSIKSNTSMNIWSNKSNKSSKSMISMSMNKPMETVPISKTVMKISTAVLLVIAEHMTGCSQLWSNAAHAKAAACHQAAQQPLGCPVSSFNLDKPEAGADNEEAVTPNLANTALAGGFSFGGTTTASSTNPSANINTSTLMDMTSTAPVGGFFSKVATASFTNPSVNTNPGISFGRVAAASSTTATAPATG